ncbi:MAG: hypothetical protein J5917_08565, partial [Bacteroidales bacterium]|nr:hypothetical protein [Bacteroidales bacterium]
KGHFSQPRLHEIGLLRHSSCKRGKHSGGKGCSRQGIRAERGVSPAAIARNRRSAAFRLQTQQAFWQEKAFSRPRLHEIGVLRHSRSKRGKHSGQKGRFSGRDCTKSAFCDTPDANATSIPAERGILPAAIAQNRRSAAFQLQTRQGIPAKRGISPGRDCTESAF